MIDSVHIKTKQNAKFTRPQVGAAQKERQAFFMLGGKRKEKEKRFMPSSKKKKKQYKEKEKNVCTYNGLSGLSSTVGCSSRRRRRH